MALDGDTTAHLTFRDLPTLLRRGDLLVLNETRVIAARVFGRRTPGGGEVEMLLLHPAGSMRYDPHARSWIALTRPARRFRRGERIRLGSFGEAVVCDVLNDGLREVEFKLKVSFERFLEQAGRMPLPPYVHNDSLEAQQRYQSVFARSPGSVAAPTASLHFTPDVLDAIEARGIEIARLSLDIGLGTFRPVVAESIDEHIMHAERYVIEPAAAAAIERALHAGRRIVAAGTTVVRSLESNFAEFGRIQAGEHLARLFSTPGFRFGVVGALITNFHLPRSTLLMLVSAFAGRERILCAYAEAIASGYRFYSFGDAMFIASPTS